MSDQLSMYSGNTRQLLLSFTRSGAPENLTGAAIQFKATCGGQPTINKSIGSGITVTSAVGGTASVAIAPSDTSGVTVTSHYDYEVQLTTSGGAVETVKRGTLVVLEDMIS